jgi:hypothetical protein
MEEPLKAVRQLLFLHHGFQDAQGAFHGGHVFDEQ